MMEQRIVISRGGLETPCLLREPEYGTPLRIVLGVHGFGGCMHEDIQENIAEEMELFGSVVLRFDFPAHGENPERELTLKGCMDTLLNVAEFARERYPELEDLCIFATGFGAYVTLISLNELIEMPGRVKLVVQTPGLRMHQTVLNMKRINKVTLEAMGCTTFNISRPLQLTYSFYEELEANNALVSYPIPFLILHGEHDDYIPREDILNLRRLSERSKLVIIPGASHRFLEEGAWDMVLDLTRDWFDHEQVLLADAF